MNSSTNNGEIYDAHLSALNTEFVAILASFEVSLKRIRVLCAYAIRWNDPNSSQGSGLPHTILSQRFTEHRWWSEAASLLHYGYNALDSIISDETLMKEPDFDPQLLRRQASYFAGKLKHLETNLHLLNNVQVVKLRKDSSPKRS